MMPLKRNQAERIGMCYTVQKDMYKFKFVIYRVKSIQLFALLFYDEGDWPTKFQIGTPRPEKNVLASLHYSAFDSASWDLCSRLTNEYEWILKSCIQSNTIS